MRKCMTQIMMKFHNNLYLKRFFYGIENVLQFLVSIYTIKYKYIQEFNFSMSHFIFEISKTISLWSHFLKNYLSVY